MTKRFRRATGTDASRREGGFSLIEVMFAIAFLGFGLLAVAQMIPVATRQVVSSKQLTDAVAAGQTQMETLKMEDFGSTLLTAGSHADTSGQYALDWTVTDNTPMAGSKKVVLSVTWNSSGASRTARMSTFIAR